jgi:glycosyltransferase involved in cell wall biosynthesis
MPKPLKIGIDIRDLKVAKTGTKTYLEELCLIFKSLENPDYKFYFFDTLLPVYTGNNKFLKLLGHFRYQFWKQVSLPFKTFIKGCDILFCTDNVVPYIHLGYKTVPVFHDAFFFENPEHFNKIWLKLTLGTAIPAARRSPIVVTPSFYAREQIHKYTNIPISKMPVIYEGPKSLSGRFETEKRIVKEPYILHVGVMNKRKNIPALINAFKELKNRGYGNLKLVLVGKVEQQKFSNNFDEIQAVLKGSDIEKDVVFTGYLPDSELPALYTNATLYVFPSLNEGFGIPVLEAFKYKVPVLVADNTCLPEIGGGAVITFNPLDAVDIASKMQMVLDDKALQTALKEKGRARLNNFSWVKTAHSLLREFERIR